VLGGGEVKLLEMTSAYSVFANDGVRNPPTGILRVEDKDGEILESYSQQSVQVLDPEIAREINDILSDNQARTPEFGADSPLYFPGYHVADKTGTTNDFRDTWIIGYTPGIAVGTWAGNNDNSPMVKKIAAFIVAPMWHQFMEYALTKYPSDDFTPPSPDTDNLPPVLMGNWNGNPSQGIHDILYWVNKDNPRSGPPTNPYADAQTSYWEYPVQLWIARGGASTTGASLGQTILSTFTQLTSPASAPGLTFISPAIGQVYPWGIPVSVSVSVPSGVSISYISYFVDGGLIGVTSQPPYSLQFNPSRHGPTTLSATAVTSQGTYRGEVTFIVQ
jgi:membrane peptidoglycan carboxypeptidase